MLCVVKVRRTVLLCTAISFATVDLVHKLLTPAHFHHVRAPFVLVVMIGLVVALVLLVPRVPSNAAAVGAGIACGGTIGNLVSLLASSQGVPDPLVVTGATQGIAFNLADVFALTGDALLLSAIILHGVRHRARLTAPVS
jgi:lipoprotein signal peptidase